jgi:superfamily II DNA or RNA helicase
MIIQAKRIIKKARDKSFICAEIISENYEVHMEKEHWLVYCEDGNQLNAVRNEIEKRNIIGKNSLYEYWSRAKGAVIDGKEMKFAGEETLARWKHTGGVMLSIACLDEGVNIEEISHGIILASSKNPRQFIQRRGRMLRLHDDKILARIWDSLVIPDSDMKHGDSTNYVLNEINRAKLFAEDSVGGNARQQLTNIRHQLNLHDVFAGGDIDGSEEDDG